MKIVKIIAIGFGVVAALLIVASIALVALFNPNDYKGYVTDWVETNTGRQLAIEDDLELSFFPWLAVETGGITVGNAAGFDGSDFAAIDRVSARVRLVPLFSGQIEIGTVSIDGLDLNLATTAEGRTNWDDLLTAATAADQGDQAPAADDAAALNDLNIEAITLRGARIVWRENTTETRYVVSDLNLETGTIAADRPLGVELTMNVLDAVSQLSGSVESSATVRLGRDGGIEASDIGVVLTWRDGEAGEQGNARITLAAFAMPPRGLMQARNGAISARLMGLPIGPPELETSASWQEVTVDRASFAVNARELAVAVGGIRSTWQVASELTGEASALISGSLTGSGPAAELLALVGTAPPAGLTAAELGNFNASGSFTFDTGTQRLDTRDVSASVFGINARAQALTLDESQNLTGSVASDGPVAGLLTLAGIERPAGVTVAELGNFTASSSFTYNTQTQQFSARDTVATALGINARASQFTTDASTTRGRIDIAPVRPNDVARRVMAAYLPADIDVNALGRIALRTDVSLQPQQTTLSGIEAELFGANLSGEVSMSSNGSIISGNITTSRFAPNELLAVMRSYLTDSIDPASAGTFALASVFRYDTNAGSARLEQLRLEAFGLNATGQLTASDLNGNASYAGQATLAAFNPREVLGRFGMPIPQTSDDRALLRASVETSFRVTPDTGTFENLVVGLDESRITGSLTVRNFSDPSYEFQLSGDNLNVDRYLPPTAEDAAPNERTAGDIELSNEQLTVLRINGAVRVGTLRLAGLDFQNVATEIIVGGGRMQLNSAQAGLYGGTFNGRFHVDASADTPSLLLEGRTSSVQVEPLLRALLGDTNFSGTANFDIDLQGRGATITENLRSAAGTLGFALTSGAIDGFNIDEILCTRYNQLSENPPPRENPPDRTPYEAIRGTATVTDGVARSNDLFARAGSFDVRGTGSLSITDELTDYKFNARLARPVPIAGCNTMDHMMNIDFPLVMTGPASALDIRPDYSEIVKRVIQDRVRDRIEDRLQDRLRDILR